MKFNLANNFELEKYKTYSEKLIEKACIVELTEKKKKRTIDQNSLFHLWVAVFADFIGEPSKESCKRDVKRELLGQKVCKNIFTGQSEFEDYKTSEMTTKELGEFMDKFKIWAQTEYGCYLPYFGDAGYEEMIEQYKNF